MDLGSVFMSEVLGTGVLILLGAGVVANVLLAKTKGFDGGWLLINLGWGLGVMAGVFVAYKSGGHINPAVTFGTLLSDANEYAPGVDITVASTAVYVSGQLVGAFLGACVAYLAYKQHFDAEEDESKKLGVFATGPEIRNYGWNFLTEAIGTFALVLVILSFAKTPHELGPVAAALLVVGIGASLGGPTGYGINPARDLGPRIAHALLPVQHRATVTATTVSAAANPELVHSSTGIRQATRKDSDWSYAWVPIVGPLVGGGLAGLLSQAVF